MSDVARVLSLLPRLLEAFELRRFRPVDAGTALTGHQLRLLRHLDFDDPVMVGELADFMGVTPSTMSLNLKRLGELGLVERRRDPADRRVVNVRLTEHGRDIRAAAPALDSGRVDAALGLLRPDERRRALEGLALLAEGADRLRERHTEYVEGLTGLAPDSRNGPEEGLG